MSLRSHLSYLVLGLLLSAGCQDPSVTEPAQGENPFANIAQESGNSAPQGAEGGAAAPVGPPGEPAPASDGSADEEPKDLGQLAEPSQSESGKVVVERPRKNERVGSLIKVEGTALVWENRVVVKILSPSGKELMEASAVAVTEEIGESGPFAVDLDLSELEPGPFQLVVMGISAKDGSPEHTVTVELDYGLLTAQ